MVKLKDLLKEWTDKPSKGPKRWSKTFDGDSGLTEFELEQLKESFQKRHFLNLIKQEIESLKGQIAYAKDALRQKDIEDWEKKEFTAVLKGNIKKLKDTEKHYKRVQKLNELGGFSSPSYTSLTGGDYAKKAVKSGGVRKDYQGYSSREAKKVIDDGLRDWAKDLRKVQYRVIKDWMSKAKAGVIDYFDLVRGLKTGDIRRAYPYETDFLFSLLNKDKIIDRFRKYFGGKKGMRKR